MATQLKGCKRGVFGLASWEPVKIPEALLQKIKENQGVLTNEPQGATTKENKENNPKAAIEPPKYVPKENEKLAAKYTYKANPSSPIGHELNLKPGAYLKFVRVADCNAHWWYCKNEEGEEGYIPASYVVTVKVTSLPWLQGREPEEPTEPTPSKVVYKPYKPTYDLKGIAHGTDKYHCEVCEKYFNGPQPYNMHMKSKAHKEEVEIAEAYKNQ